MPQEGASDLLEKGVHGRLRASGFGLQAWQERFGRTLAEANGLPPEARGGSREQRMVPEGRLELPTPRL
jgi:hypothetical protein